MRPTTQPLLQQVVDGLSHSFSTDSPCMSLGYWWRRQKTKSWLSDRVKHFTMEICKWGVISTWQGGWPSRLRVGRACCWAVRGSPEPAAQQRGGWDLSSWVQASQDRLLGPVGICWSWCRITQLWKQGVWIPFCTVFQVVRSWYEVQLPVWETILPQNERKKVRKKERKVKEKPISSVTLKGFSFLHESHSQVGGFGQQGWPVHGHSLALLCPPFQHRLRPQRHLWPRALAGALARTS